MASQETVEQAPEQAFVYAEPRVVTELEECYFYHSMEIPGYGLVEGPWDLRGGVDDYLGGVDLNGKRVLEVGTASGFLCYTMEGRGADVVAYDLSDEQSGTAPSSRRPRSSTGRSMRSRRRSGAFRLPLTATCCGISVIRSSRSSGGCG